MSTAVVGPCRPRGAWRGAGLAAIAVLALTAPAAGAQEPPAADAPARSTLDGVFTEAQAERGQGTFEESCAVCHAQGYFTTTTFRRSWSGRAIYYLFSTIRSTMPQDNPGSLRPREIADLLAYILRLNAYPEGAEPLPDDRDALRRIVWEELPADPEH